MRFCCIDRNENIKILKSIKELKGQLDLGRPQIWWLYLFLSYIF
jgi:hypothetical protein